MNFKKILSAIGLFSIAVPASLSVVACGPTEQAKIDITELITVKKIKGFEANDQAKVLAKIIELNKDSKLTDKELEIKKDSFKAAEIDKAGEATIAAKADTKFTGEVKITITALLPTEEKEVIEAITTADYTINVIAGSLASDLVESITNDFLKEKLSDEIKEILKDSLEVNDVEKADGSKILRKDLENTGTLEAKILYSYEENKHETNLTVIIEQE